jgi:plasmid stabilization system protein ParE
MPGMGHRRTDVRDQRYHFWRVRSYIIAYRYDANDLTIVRVLHGARDFRTIFRDSTPEA